MAQLTRKDLATAAPGIYIVRVAHPREPLETDPVLEGPLPGTSPEDQRRARDIGKAWSLRSGGGQVELVAVVDLNP